MSTLIRFPERRHYDAIVIGVGAMGGAALRHLAERGLRVLGIERFSIPNSFGSSHGPTRIFRLAYFQGSGFVPLAIRARRAWRQLEDECGEQFLISNGSVDAGPEGSETVESARLSCEENALPYEMLTGAELNRRFPGYGVPEDFSVLYQEGGGVLRPEPAIVCQVRQALANGAVVHACEKVSGWRWVHDEAQVVTDRATYSADRLVITAGPWVSQLLPSVGAVVTPERQVVAHFAPRSPELFTPERFPPFNLIVDEGHYYGCPELEVPGFKFGRAHHRHESVDPDCMERRCDWKDEAVVRHAAERFFPGGVGQTLSLETCLFTNSPDRAPVVDRVPGLPRVAYAAGFTGHGFKFAPLIGEALADLVEHGSTRTDLASFGFDRFAPTGSRKEGRLS